MQKKCHIPYIVKYGENEFRAFLACLIDGEDFTLYGHGATCDEARLAVENQYHNLGAGLFKRVLVEIKPRSWNLTHGASAGWLRPDMG